MPIRFHWDKVTDDLENMTASNNLSDNLSNSSYGPSALLTPANLLTLMRIVAAPIVVYLIVRYNVSWYLMGIWAVISFSDGLDGIVARRMGATRSGAFLDPLADKFAVLGALFAYVYVGRINIIVALLITFREVTMSVYRTFMSKKNVSIPARFTAKIKTFVQDSAIGLATMPILLKHNVVITVAIFIALALTLYTGTEYFIDGIKATGRLTGKSTEKSNGKSVNKDSRNVK